MKYRTKDVEAFQMTKERRWDNSEWPHWLNEAWNRMPDDENALFCGEEFQQKEGAETLYVHRHATTSRVLWNHWLIYDQYGDITLMWPARFAALYEPVAESAAPSGQPAVSVV